MTAKANGRVKDREKLLAPLLVNTTRSEPGSGLPDVPECQEAFPLLNAFLTVTEVEGKPRSPATITFWVEDLGVKAVMNDRALKRKLWAVAPSIMGLLGELEAALTSKTPKWMDDTGTRPKRPS